MRTRSRSFSFQDPHAAGRKKFLEAEKGRKKTEACVAAALRGVESSETESNERLEEMAKQAKRRGFI